MTWDWNPGPSARSRPARNLVLRLQRYRYIMLAISVEEELGQLVELAEEQRLRQDRA